MHVQASRVAAHRRLTFRAYACLCAFALLLLAMVVFTEDPVCLQMAHMWRQGWRDVAVMYCIGTLGAATLCHVTVILIVRIVWQVADL
jgi:hypothetical protein